MKHSPYDSLPRHVSQLTWLRGFAAYFVVISHVIRATEVAYDSNDHASDPGLLGYFDLGTFGVLLFFVLSGCTLYISNANKVGRGELIDFYLKRFFRIWPAFFISLVCYIGFAQIFQQYYGEARGNWIEEQFLASYSLADIVSYLSLTFNITGPAGLFNNAYWSLPIEFQYYLLFPLIIWSLRIAGSLGPIVIGGSLYLLPKLGVDYLSGQVFTLAFSFCGGVLVGYVSHNIRLSLSPLVGAGCVLLLLLLASLVSRGDIALPDVPVISNLWNFYGLTGIVIAYVLLNTHMVLPAKADAFLTRCGDISYSLYLYHNLFIALSILVVIHFEIFDPTARLLLVLVATTLLTYIAAVFSYRYIEQPSIRYGRKISQRRRLAKSCSGSLAVQADVDKTSA